MKRIKLWLLKKLFTKDEKYLLIMAIETRVVRLEEMKVLERTINPENADTDIHDLLNLRKIFSTKSLYR